MLAFVSSCEEKVYDDLSFLDNTTAPSSLSALVDITQDNTGLVTITPMGEGISSFEITFGDGSETETLTLGESVQHTYTHGTYTVKVAAISITGLTTKFEQEITVSFDAPTNIEVVTENDLLVSKQVNITATADDATFFDVFFGEGVDEVATLALPGETVSHIYTNPGDYDIVVIAKSGSPETLTEAFTFTVTEINGPVVAAPTPPSRDAANVISIFSGAYTDVEGSNFNPNWGQSTIVAQIDVDGNATLNYANLNYQGTDFGSTVDASGMEFLHIDMWTEDASAVSVYPISTATGEKNYDFTIVAGEWQSYDIPLSYFTDLGLGLDDLFQFKFTGTDGSSIYLDNLYFYKGASVATEPASAAPIPNRLEANVISIFSDSYTDVANTDFNPNWGQATTYSLEDLAGNSMINYSGLNYQGIGFENSVDASSMAFLHFDMWTFDATTVNVYCISAGNEVAFELPIVAGLWNSYNIPLSHFSGTVDLANLIQFKFDDGTTGEGATIYLDNLYFYK